MAGVGKKSLLVRRVINMRAMMWRAEAANAHSMPSFPYPRDINISRHQPVKARPAPVSADTRSEQLLATPTKAALHRMKAALVHCTNKWEQEVAKLPESEQRDESADLGAQQGQHGNDEDGGQEEPAYSRYKRIPVPQAGQWAQEQHGDKAQAKEVRQPTLHVLQQTQKQKPPQSQAKPLPRQMLQHRHQTQSLGSKQQTPSFSRKLQGRSKGKVDASSCQLNDAKPKAKPKAKTQAQDQDGTKMSAEDKQACDYAASKVHLSRRRKYQFGQPKFIAYKAQDLRDMKSLMYFSSSKFASADSTKYKPHKHFRLRDTMDIQVKASDSADYASQKNPTDYASNSTSKNNNNNNNSSSSNSSPNTNKMRASVKLNPIYKLHKERAAELEAQRALSMERKESATHHLVNNNNSHSHPAGNSSSSDLLSDNKLRKVNNEKQAKTANIVKSLSENYDDGDEASHNRPEATAGQD